MKSKNTVAFYLLLIVGVLVLLNILSNKFFVRFDFTADKRYTLSEATEDILTSLPETVTITAYFTEDLPPQYTSLRRDFKEMLIEYSNLSDGMLVYEFVDPSQDEETEQNAMKAGIQPLVINVNEKDRAVQKKAYLGAIIQMGEQKEVLPFVQPGGGMEYLISSNIKKLSVIDKPVIALLQGHGEPPINAYQQVLSELSVLYNVIPVQMSDTTAELNNYTTLAIVNPKDTIPPSHLMQLDGFLANGGKMFIACNRVEGNLQTASGSTIYTGLETWLKSKGVTIENNFIIDASCASVGVQQPNFPFPIQIQFPYLPIITNFEDHPITKSLEAVLMQFASSITYTGDTTLKFQPIAKSSEKSGTQPVPTYFDVEKQWTEADFPLKNLTVAATLSGKIVGDKESKIVVVADGDFPINGVGQETRQIQPDNASLMVNSIDWLTDDTGLIALRTKGVTARPLDQIEDFTKLMLKIMNFLLPILVVIIFGFLRMLYTKNLRMKRMEKGYVD